MSKIISAKGAMLILILTSLLPGLVAAQAPVLDDAYYNKLRQNCRNNSKSLLNEDSCCLASVDNMQERKAMLHDPVLTVECPAGYSKNMLKCSSTFQWCEPDGSQPPATPSTDTSPTETKPVEAKPEEPKAIPQTEPKPEETKEVPKAETK